MHTLTVNLINPDGFRLTVSCETLYRSVGAENETASLAVAEVNECVEHKKYGPWVLVSSRYET